MNFELNENEIVVRHFFVNYPKAVRTYRFHHLEEEEIVRRRYNECTIALYNDKESETIFIGWAKLGKKEKQFNRKMGKKIAVGRLKNVYKLAAEFSTEALRNDKYVLPTELNDIVICCVEDFRLKIGVGDVEPKKRSILRKNTGN